MLTKQLKGTLPAALTLTGQGESVTFNVTYHNRRQSELLAELEKAKDPAELVLFLVESMESEYALTPEGIKQLEDDRPGMVLFLIDGFHKARRVGAEKN